jgi:type IV secretory pathway VirD2 relaxase
MHYARMSASKRLGRRPGSPSSRGRPHFQRCAVRVMYSKNTTTGQWRAHGRYIARESATHDSPAKAVGFDSTEESVRIDARLEDWQKAQDERLWKLIISPEFGDRTDLKRLARDLVSQMEKDLGASFEWVGVAHYNTEHPHVHLALRGISTDARPLRLQREYVKQGIRGIAEDLCTRQLGYRTQLDGAAAQQREVDQNRYTSLDRIIKRNAANARNPDSSYVIALKEPTDSVIGPSVAQLQRHIGQRLKVLESMGLADCIAPSTWRVRQDFENVLRAMQRSTDRQKTLAQHGVPMSDQRLQVVVLDFRDLRSLEGRVLVHGEEDNGRAYLMLEATIGRIHYVPYTPEMEKMRSRGALQSNSFIRLQKIFSGGQPFLEVSDSGDAESILRNKPHLLHTAQQLLRRGVVPQDDGWSGWLGRYQKALQRVAADLQRERSTKEANRKRDRDRDRGR